MRVETQIPPIPGSAIDFNRSHPHPPAHYWRLEASNIGSAETLIGWCTRDGCTETKEFPRTIYAFDNYREPLASRNHIPIEEISS